MKSDRSKVALTSKRAVVLGGGGPVGRAWMKGLATGLLAFEIDLGRADIIIGTSAGAILGSHLALGLDTNLNAPLVNPIAYPVASPALSSGMQEMMAASARATSSLTPEVEWERVGRMALAADTTSEEVFLAQPMFAAANGYEWPSNLCATCVDTRTGRFQVWSAASGVPIDRGVASSAALPGLWPPVTVGNDRYMDGGVRSMLNSDLAAGYSSVVIFSCFALTAPPQGTDDTITTLNSALVDKIDSLRRGGSVVEVVMPDGTFVALTRNGTMMLDNSLVPQAYEAGKCQALDEADRICRIWASAA